MRLIFCGDRYWNDPDPILHKLIEISRRLGTEGVTIIHGAARGADSMAGSLAKRFGFEVERFPAQWERYGKRCAGAVRNAAMLDAGVDAIYGYKNGFDLKFNKGGTEQMIEMGLRNDVPVEVWHLEPGASAKVLGVYSTYEITWPLPDPWGSRT